MQLRNDAFCSGSSGSDNGGIISSEARSFLAPCFRHEHYEREQQQGLRKHLDITKILRQFPHVLEVGMTGAGKGNNISEWIECAIDAGMKVVSIHNPGSEVEAAFKRYPTGGKYADLVKKRGRKPRGFDVKVYLPVCKGYTPNQIPDFFQPYTLPVSGYPTISPELLATVNMVGLTDISKDAMDGIMGSFSDTDNLAHFYYELNYMMEHGITDKETKLWFSVITPRSRESLERIIFALLQKRMMTDAKYPLALTADKVQEMLNRQDELTVFTQAYLPNGLKPFACLHIMKAIFDNEQYAKHPILLVATEVQKILVNPERTRINSAKELFTNMVADMGRAGRKFNIHLLVDTQILSSINPDFVSQALLAVFYTQIRDDNEMRMIERNAPYIDRQRLRRQIQFLRHDPKKGYFEYYVPALHQRFMVELPTTQHPWEGEKGRKGREKGSQANFLKYVREHDRECTWGDTTYIYGEIEEEIKRVVDTDATIRNYIEARKAQAHGLEREILGELEGAGRGKEKKKGITVRERRVAMAKKLRSEGYMWKEIAKKMKCHIDTVGNYLKEE